MTYAQVLDEASQLGSRGKVAQEAQLLRDFLAQPQADPNGTSLVLSGLGSAQLRLGGVDAAIVSLERALATAREHGLQPAEAKASLLSANLYLSLAGREGGAKTDALWEQGMQHSMVAAQLYETLGKIDFLAALLTMAEGG